MTKHRRISISDQRNLNRALRLLLAAIDEADLGMSDSQRHQLMKAFVQRIYDDGIVLTHQVSSRP